MCDGNSNMNMDILMSYLVLAFTTLVACPSLVEGSTDPLEIKLGVLIPAVSDKEDIPEKSRALTAIQIGLEKVRLEGLVRDVNFTINYKDSKCSGTQAPLLAMEMYYKKESHVFFGPMCTYATSPVARYSPYWQIPVITPGARADGFKDKDEYKLLTRMSGSYSNTADAVHSILSNFSWKQIGIIYHNNKVNTNVGDAETFFLCKPVYDKLDKSTHQWSSQIDVNYMDQFNLGSILREGSVRCRGKTDTSLLYFGGSLQTEILISSSAEVILDNCIST